jgi:hypothetical protein
MNRICSSVLVTVWTIAWALSPTDAAHAQQPAAPEQEVAPQPEDYNNVYRPIPSRVQIPTLAQQKAQARGEQRMARLEAMKWYGFSNSRPTATAMPWTTMYSPAWQQPGGRPFAWYVSSRPVLIFLAPQEMYR